MRTARTEPRADKRFRPGRRASRALRAKARVGTASVPSAATVGRSAPGDGGSGSARESAPRARLLPLPRREICAKGSFILQGRVAAEQGDEEGQRDLDHVIDPGHE